MIRWTETKELRWEGAIRECREGGRRDETVGNSFGKAPVGRSDTGGRGETVRNSLGRAPVRRSDTGVTTGWTEGKPWEIAPWGRSEMEAMRRWTGKAWEIAWGEGSGGEGARWKLREGGPDGEHRGKYSMGRELRWEGAIRE